MKLLLTACLALPLGIGAFPGTASGPVPGPVSVAAQAVTRGCGGHPSDFDGDGRPDLAVAAPYDDRRAGSVTVLYGSGRQDRLTQDGAEPGDAFGSALAVGDFDGDGCADLAVGVSEEFAGARVPGADGNGVVEVFHGSPGGLAWKSGLALRRPSSDRFGASLAAGDFDGDGRDELAVGAPGHRTGGAVTVYWMKGRGPEQVTQGTRWVRQAAGVTDQWGATLAAGDFDGDGRDELAVGAPADSAPLDGQGSVTVLDVKAHAARRFTQATPGIAGAAEKWDGFGAALATGDFNGDGRDDLAVGVPGEGLSANQRAMDYGDGTVDVLYGSGGGLRAAGSEAWSQRSLTGVPRYYDRFGAALAAGDFNGDGNDDLAIGVPGERAVQVVRGGRPGGLTRRGDLLVKGEGRDFGAALAAVPARGGRFRPLSAGRPLDALVAAAPDQGLVLYAPGVRGSSLRLGRLRRLTEGTGLYGYAFG
ncbi:FG-GAP and VCBS repeat-containing protein [Nonomuraea pusilla]|uniref:FG-GAP repeat-containing protein n=1 Tax=Nonomuraea pusilla TaxID=46177 RepID=A0A1H7XP67_9ACTN|nr:FG-GAP and VCBS repeat-containing protein [Nonomuraea pusilla]SEM35424.1 FG-GAP repeat-containing protein [Nonomuraea pusilla]